MIELAPDLFVEESTVRFYGVRLRTRMAVVRLEGSRLFLYSPVFLTPAVRSDLSRLGDVTFVVSPNKIHHQAWPAYQEAYPGARFLAPPGLPERRPDLRFDGVLGDAPESGWEGALDHVLTAGNVFFSEAVFFQRSTGTLLVADLVENFDEHTASRLGRGLAALFGVGSRPVASPEFRLYTHDAEAAEAAFARIRAWPFHRIFLCHGALIERDAPAVFAGVCRGVVEAARRRGRISRWLLRRLAGLQ